MSDHAIDISTEPAEPATTPRAMTLNQAAAFISETTGCRRPHINTLFRWAKKGVRGQRLHVVRVGRTFWTTRQDVADFLARLNSQPSSDSSPLAAQVIRAQRERHARMVHDALARELGIDETEQECVAAGSAADGSANELHVNE